MLEYIPDIRYNPQNETFYLSTTQFSGSIGNMVVKTKDSMKRWRDLIKFDFQGIDPSIFFDDDGKAYVVHNDVPNEGEELYQGHRFIKILEYDVENDQVVEGTY